MNTTTKLLRLTDPELESAPKDIIATQATLARMAEIVIKADGFHHSGIGTHVRSLMLMADSVLDEMTRSAVAKVRK